MADRAQNEVAKERRAKAVAQRKKHDEEKKAEMEKDMGPPGTDATKDASGVWHTE